MNYYKFENEKYELLKYEKLILIKNKYTNIYYEMSNTDKFIDVSWDKYLSKINNKVFMFYIGSLVFFFIINMYFSFMSTPKSVYNNMYISIISLIYTLVNVIVHEGAHIISLKLFNKKIDKIGIKMNYIFPSVYVRMNDVYMLTRTEKIIVHSAGIYANLLLNSIIMLMAHVFSIDILFIAGQLFIFGIIMNTVPVLNSDGYKVMLAIFMSNEKKDKVSNSIFIKLVGYINVLLAFFYLIKLIFDII